MPKLRIKILEDKQSLGRTTAEHAARSLRVAIRDRGLARLIACASQFFEFLEALTRAPDIDWAKVELFHLDEWVGLPITHPVFGVLESHFPAATPPSA